MGKKKKGKMEMEKEKKERKTYDPYHVYNYQNEISCCKSL